MSTNKQDHNDFYGQKCQIKTVEGKKLNSNVKNNKISPNIFNVCSVKIK